MKYIFFFILLFSLNSLNAMRYSKLTAAEVQTIASNQELLRRLEQEGQRVKAQLNPEDFQRLERVWTLRDVLCVQTILRRSALSSNRSVYHNGQHSELLVLVSPGEVKTIFHSDQKQISLEILEFCGFATYLGFQRRARDEQTPEEGEVQYIRRFISLPDITGL